MQQCERIFLNKNLNKILTAFEEHIAHIDSIVVVDQLKVVMAEGGIVDLVLVVAIVGVVVQLVRRQIAAVVVE